MGDNNFIMKFLSPREPNSMDGYLYSEHLIWNTIFSIRFQEEQMVGESFVVNIFKSARRFIIAVPQLVSWEFLYASKTLYPSQWKAR